MSNKRKREKLAARRERRRRRHLAEVEALKPGPEIPPGALAADVSKWVPINSYSPPPPYYLDKEFTCVDCGREEVWSAHQQKWYYEVAKGSPYATAVRCRACRHRRREQGGRGDLFPMHSIAALMNRIRSRIEKPLRDAGFTFCGRYNGARTWPNQPAWLEYSRPDLILRCVFEFRDARLIAETLDDRAEYREVANVQLEGSNSNSAMLARIAEFSAAVGRFLQA